MTAAIVERVLSQHNKNKIIQQNTKITNFFEDYSKFIDKTETRHNDYLREISNYASNATNLLNELNDNRSITEVYKRFYDVIDGKSKTDSEFIKKFFLTHHVSLLRKIMSNEQITLFNNLSKKMINIQDIFNGSINKSMLNINNKKLLLLDVDNADSLKKRYERVIKNLDNRHNKIISYINLNISILDMIMDKQFLILYAIKIIRCFFNYVSFFITTRIFTPIYEQYVYDKKQNPPSLSLYLLIFLILDFSLNTFLVVVLLLLKFMFKSESNTFPIDYNLLIMYGVDYASCTSITIILGLLLGNVIKNKRYFAYKYEGLRGIRAFESMMWRVSAIINIVPFFMIYQSVF